MLLREVNSVDSPASRRLYISGEYVVIKLITHIRDGAGIGRKSIVTIPKYTKVVCDGYYTRFYGTKWLYVETEYKNTRYCGFCSVHHLNKIS